MIRRRDSVRAGWGLLKKMFAHTIGFLGRYRVWREELRVLYWFIPDSYATALLDSYKPDLVFAPNMFSPEDCRLMKAAMKRGIPTVATAKSWDVLTNKAFTRVRANKLLVFNAFNFDEAITLGDYKKEQVTITGFPQFDVYADSSTFIDREQFCKRIGIDPKKEIILFAVPGDWKFPYTDEVIKHIDDAIESGALPQNVHVLARVHPKYPTKVESRTDYKHVTIERPGTYFSGKQEKSIDTSSSGTLAWTFTSSDILHLANSIHHSAVTINIESTMTLDAIALNKPVVLIGYDGDHALPPDRSIAENYTRTHYQNVMDTKAARLAVNKEDLIACVRAYLDDPKLDSSERVVLKDRLLYKVDGQSAKRVATALLEML
jgi:CDP-glycerol glycerophosphotransferase (TagB/SpsB family)